MNALLPQATTYAPAVDALLLALTLIALAVLALVFGLMLFYCFRYRANSPIDRGRLARKTWRIETAWTVASLLAFFGLFIWGARLYWQLFQPPSGALKVYVIGKRWMWKVEHPGGQREINALHVPTGRPVQLVMTSQDVIHDFAVPAFRIKHDVLPGRYETLWFTVQRPGAYRLYCTQLCGADHAHMVGTIFALAPQAFARWLASTPASPSLAAQGEVLFMRYGCSGCHGGNGVGGAQAGSAVRAPALRGLYGGLVPLADGQLVRADDRYLRDHILHPEHDRVAGFEPVMPSFAGQIGEEELLAVVAYLESLGGAAP